eukprot:GFUD01018365.1.p1 GENE.GFUD01018365.1~~GFUD01018365.1.p1  ORF type:complete len:378 (+),score=75.50 GFUD01018365.1:136-1269(+)
MMEYKAYTQYSGAEAWLHATYPHLHAVWTQAIANRDFSITFNNILRNICTICNVKPISGTHYGVKICEADKQFLKRTFHYQIVYSPCTKEGEGVCPPRPRGWCQMCRLRFCMATPINISMIRIGDKAAGGGKNKKSSAKPHKSPESFPFTFQMTIQQPEQELLFPDNYSLSDPLAFSPPSFQFSPFATTTTPSFYDIPSFYRTPSPTLEEHSNPPSFYAEQKQCLKPDPKVSQDCTPLDLSVKPRPSQDTEQWFTDELIFTECPTKLLILPPREEPLDLTTASSASSSPTKSLFSKPSLFGLDISRSSMSRPSSADGRIRSTPSPVLEASYGLNKLSVNSTVLGDALALIQANISESSLANLSSVSDILNRSDVDKS